MAHVLLLLPDFLLILVGFAVCRWTPLKRGIWEAAERLVYYMLFPVLLFGSIVRSPLRPAAAASLVAVGLGTLAAGIVMAYALRRWPKVDATAHASGAQTAFRFNSFLGLALADRLAGSQGVALMAVLIAVSVPVCNVAAVLPLARHGGHNVLKELMGNPLIIATLCGLAGNAVGLQLPEPVAITLGRIGQAALPLGLMAVGAGLHLGAVREHPGLAAGLLGIRHLALPLVALGLADVLALPPLERSIAVAFGALPTASSAYVLAVRMRGNGPFVAGLITVSTMLGMATIPVWLAIGLPAR